MTTTECLWGYAQRGIINLPDLFHKLSLYGILYLISDTQDNHFLFKRNSYRYKLNYSYTPHRRYLWNLDTSGFALSFQIS